MEDGTPKFLGEGFYFQLPRTRLPYNFVFYLFDKQGKTSDYAGCHGRLIRLMRDLALARYFREVSNESDVVVITAIF